MHLLRVQHLTWNYIQERSMYLSESGCSIYSTCTHLLPSDLPSSDDIWIRVFIARGFKIVFLKKFSGVNKIYSLF